MNATRLNDNEMCPGFTSDQLAEAIGVIDYCRHGLIGIVHCPSCSSDCLGLAIQEVLRLKKRKRGGKR